MTSVDTNVIVRLVTSDDPLQARRAARLISRDRVHVTKTALLEAEWVLRGAYDLPRAVIHRSLVSFLGLPQVTVEDGIAVRAALDAYGAGLDFADAMHLASSHDCARFATFDRKVRRDARRISVKIATVAP